MSGETDPKARYCFKKQRTNSAKLRTISFEGSTVSVAAVPLESEECDQDCSGEIRETRHIGGFALPQFCDKRICPMSPEEQ